MFCPTTDSYYGISSDRYGVQLIPCFTCLANMHTSCAGVTDTAPWGPAARTTCQATLSAAAVMDPSDSGSVVAYAAASACVLQPGWGWVTSTYGPPGNQTSKAFVQQCPEDTYSPGGEHQHTSHTW